MNRLRIFQSNRLLQPIEIAHIENKLGEFIKEWNAHGDPLAASFEIRYNFFIFIRVDESKVRVTGCSIDKLVRLIKSIEDSLRISLLDPTQIAYRRFVGQPIEVVPQPAFQALLNDKVLDPNEVIVFNNMITEDNLLINSWEVPLRRSWHARVYL